MRTREAPLARRIEESLTQFESSVGSLPGISQSAQRDVFVEQLVESDRRRRYVQRLVESKLSPSRTDPRSENFDPLRAAIVFQREGKVEEAFWMLFLFVHFGKHRVAGWRYAARVYGKLEDTTRWDWRNVCLDVSGFREWLDQNSEMIKAGSDRRGFGNHRKYESLSGSSMSGTGAVVASYVEWVGPTQSHVKRVRILLSDVGDNPSVAFDYLYQSMNSVQRFGRTARFDYLSMAGKIGLIDIVPGRAYLVGSTGPFHGARLLFGEIEGHGASATTLETRLSVLQTYLELGFDVIEDALCNWQKSPTEFRPFRG